MLRVFYSTMNRLEETEPPIVKPIVKTQDALSDLRIFEELKSKLLSKGDYQLIQGKNFIKKSGWRKLALVFNISDEIIEKAKTEREDGSFVWAFRVRATAPNGRYTESVGSCDSNERKFFHAEHDVQSTAHTRAKSRAISDLIGAGEITAEELHYDDSKDSERETKAEERTITPKLQKEIKTTTRIELKMDGKDFPVKENEGPFTRFFLNKVCNSQVSKNADSWYQLEKNDSSEINAILFYNIDKKSAKEIENTLSWTLGKIRERRGKTSEE